MAKINLTDISTGDIFSEQSHYRFLGKKGNQFQFTHLESNNTINLDSQYVSDLLKTADVFDKEVEVGKEDKFWTEAQLAKEVKGTGDHRRAGDLKQKGIRSIWADIHSQQVFQVNFDKQGKELSDKAYTEALQKQTDEAIAAIEKAQKAKKGIASAALDAIKKIQSNPISQVAKGEERTLRGYKTQFSSINGQYDVIDMDITTGSPKRVVNVNAINWLVFDNVKYVVK